MTVTLSGVTLRGVECHDWTPKRLFAAGEQGAWYDPSDLSTLFQDAAGTTPVTAVEQPVGKILDKSGRGNHATASADANRPTLSARYNLLTKTEQFDDATAWKVGDGSVSANSTTDPLGGSGADTLVENTGTVQPYCAHSPSIAFTSGVAYTGSMYVKAAGRAIVSLYFDAKPFPDSGRVAWFDLSDQTMQAQSGVTTAISSAGNGWYKCSITVTADAVGAGVTNSIGVFIAPSKGSLATYTGDGTSGIYIWGADLRVANESASLPAYQRVNTSTDYDTSGFPPYLAFNGTSSAMATGSIDFTATDKMTVCAGVRKLSDAAYGHIIGANGNSAGAFELLAGGWQGLGAMYGFAARGSTAVATTQSQTPTNYAAPITNVVVTTADVSSGTNGNISYRINGAAVAPTLVAYTQSGTFSNNALYIGVRPDASLPLSGRLYSLIVRGAATSAADITNTETWVNRKTGAY